MIVSVQWTGVHYSAINSLGAIIKHLASLEMCRILPEKRKHLIFIIVMRQHQATDN